MDLAVVAAAAAAPAGARPAGDQQPPISWRRTSTRTAFRRRAVVIDVRRRVGVGGVALSRARATGSRGSCRRESERWTGTGRYVLYCDVGDAGRDAGGAAAADGLEAYAFRGGTARAPAPAGGDPRPGSAAPEHGEHRVRRPRVSPSRARRRRASLLSSGTTSSFGSGRRITAVRATPSQPQRHAPAERGEATERTQQPGADRHRLSRAPRAVAPGGQEEEEQEERGEQHRRPETGDQQPEHSHLLAVRLYSTQHVIETDPSSVVECLSPPLHIASQRRRRLSEPAPPQRARSRPAAGTAPAPAACVRRAGASPAARPAGRTARDDRCGWTRAAPDPGRCARRAADVLRARRAGGLPHRDGLRPRGQRARSRRAVRRHLRGEGAPGVQPADRARGERGGGATARGALAGRGRAAGSRLLAGPADAGGAQARRRAGRGDGGAGHGGAAGARAPGGPRPASSEAGLPVAAPSANRFTERLAHHGGARRRGDSASGWI